MAPPLLAEGVQVTARERALLSFIHKFNYAGSRSFEVFLAASIITMGACAYASSRTGNLPGVRYLGSPLDADGTPTQFIKPGGGDDTSEVTIPLITPSRTIYERFIYKNKEGVEKTGIDFVFLVNEKHADTVIADVAKEGKLDLVVRRAPDADRKRFWFSQIATGVLLWPMQLASYLF
jgi:hypothetical protein